MWLGAALFCWAVWVGVMIPDSYLEWLFLLKLTVWLWEPQWRS